MIPAVAAVKRGWEPAVAFWPHRIDEGEPGSGGRRPLPDLEQLRQALQHRFERVLAPLAALLRRLGASADQVSVTGFVLNVASAALVVTGDLVAAGALYLFAGLLDLLDGVLARAGGKPTRFGAFLDSTLDRASEGVVFAAIGYRFAAEGAAVDAGIVVLALLGSFLVSYVRARAEGLGAKCRVGIATRAERVVLIALGLLGGMLPEAVRLVALLTAFTVAQRIACARRELRAAR